MIFYAISDRKQASGGSLARQLDGYFRLGADWIQIREKDLSDRELLEAAVNASERARETGTKVFVNGRADIAEMSGASGVHLPSDSPPVEKIKQSFPRLLIIKSCHSLDDAISAEKSGAHFVTVGPVFSTPSKEGILDPIGIEGLNNVCARCRIPVIALGGIGPESIAAVVQAGAYGIAGIRLFNCPESGRKSNFLAALRAETA